MNLNKDVSLTSPSNPGSSGPGYVNNNPHVWSGFGLGLWAATHGMSEFYVRYLFNSFYSYK
ncbi:hypothetical protein M378DRAFT_173605 [Amanita muscaria Koide BX008]|uniref:Uncharacterized protein n=1 Tax=Amanita muscaria (strain Koide BX008) TaxID=946122 RepID=A0A0C2WFW3_AMAMK|nr:hypothetical protein M378DRAFT_173605 [Amanita muscaria Koide BX008]